MSMRMANTEETKAIIEQVFKGFKQRDANHEILFITCVEMVSTCLEFLAEASQSYSGVFQNQLNLFEEINRKKTLDEMEKWIKEVFTSTIELVHRNKSSKSKRIVENVKKYIHDNFTNEELTMEDLSRHLFMDYSHLSYLFKKNTGLTMNEYLTEIRIKRAKELIDGGNHLIQDISDKVGYSDANYFGKCFKKFYGLSPSKYIENVK